MSNGVETTTEAAPVAEYQLNEAERGFALAQRQAQALSQSDLVPTAYKGNVANCLIALNLANRIGCDPLQCIQNLDIIRGRPSFRATFLIAAVNMCGRFTPLRYRIEGEGDERTCTAYATDKEVGDIIEGPPVSIAMAKAEGWYQRQDSKWPTLPDLMLRYRSAAFFARTIAPELVMGLHTQDEMEDIAPTPRTQGPAALSATEALEKARDITPEPDAEVEQPADEPTETTLDKDAPPDDWNMD